MKTALVALLTLYATMAFAAPAKELTPPDVLGKAKTIHVLAVRYQNDVEKEVSEAWLAQPNKAYAEDTNRQIGGITNVYVSDGKIQAQHRPSAGPDTRSLAPARIAQIQTQALVLKVLLEFYTPARFARFVPGPKNEEIAQYSRLSSTVGQPAEWTILTIDRKTGLPRTYALMSQRPDGLIGDDDDTPPGRPKADPNDQRIDFHGWALNAPIRPQTFMSPFPPFVHRAVRVTLP